MSKLQTTIAIVGCASAAAAAVIAFFQFKGDATLETGQQIAKALTRIEAAVREGGVSIDADGAASLDQAFESLTTRIASAATVEEEAFVPASIARSFEGVSDYARGQAIEIVAPNGGTKAFAVLDTNDLYDTVTFRLDNATSRLGIAEYSDVPFGDASCRIMNVAIVDSETDMARLKIDCGS